MEKNKDTANGGAVNAARRALAIALFGLAALPVVFCAYATAYHPPLVLLSFAGLMISALLVRGGMGLWR